MPSIPFLSPFSTISWSFCCATQWCRVYGSSISSNTTPHSQQFYVWLWRVEMYTERKLVVPTSIFNDHSMWVSQLDIKATDIETESMISPNYSVHCCIMLEGHFEDCMIFLGSRFPTAFWAILLTLICATKPSPSPSGHHDCAFVQNSHFIPPCKDNRLHIHIYIHFHRSRIHENHYGCKYVPTSCALSSLSLIPKPRLLKNTSQICLHHNSTWILERAHTNIICHDLLVTQEAVDLVQEFETNHWHDSDLLSKQNESLDWAEFLYFILETNLVQVFILCVGTQSWNLLLLLTRQHHTWEQIQKYIKVLQYFNLWTQFENLYLAIVTGCIKSRTRTCFKLLNPLFVEFHVDYRVGKFWYTYLYLDHNMVKREIKGLNTIVNVNGVNYMFDQASSTMWCSTHSCMCVGFGAKVAMLPWQKDFQTGIVMIGIDWAPGSMCAQTFLTAGTDVAMTALIGGKLAIMIPLYPDCVWGVDGR